MKSKNQAKLSKRFFRLQKVHHYASDDNEGAAVANFDDEEDERTTGYLEFDGTTFSSQVHPYHYFFSSQPLDDNVCIVNRMLKWRR